MKKKEQYVVDCMIPTYKPGKEFLELLRRLQQQTYPIHKIWIVNTEEQYFCKEDLSGYGTIEICHISHSEFDHGGTRAMIAKRAACDVLVYMTQDAMPKNKQLVSSLISALEVEQAAVTYAKQLPAKDCHFIERYTRSFNYGEERLIKGQEQIASMGIKTFFCSDVCAAYDMVTYHQLGGFVEKTIFNEDMIYAAKAVRAGYKVVYEPMAEVIHSHNYGNLQQLRRNFDMGVSQAQYPETFAGVPSESEGIRLVKKTMSYLIKQKKPWLVPKLIVNSGFKFIGYRLGKGYRRLPKKLIRSLTMNLGYWEKPEQE